MDWRDQRYIEGGYRVPAPGSIVWQGSALHAEQQGLHICGEHTCFSFGGYMEGAFRSGATVAKRLASA